MDQKINIKRYVIDFSKIIIFLSICVLLLNVLSPLFVPKNNNDQSGIKYENARGFYGERANSIDILAIGNSDLYSAMNPLQLWKDHGLTSYVCGEPQQSLCTAYYLLKEVLTCQKPKLVILEVDELFTKKESDDIDEAINNALKYAFPLFEYHSRWKDIDMDELKNTDKDYNSRMESKGYLYHNNTESNPEGFKYMGKKRKSELTKTTKLYLQKFIDLARSQGADVLFVWYPSATTASTSRHMTVQKLAKQYDVPFIDFNMNQYDTDFNWKTDTRDGGNHLNYFGATKMTKYMGQYIKENYQLNDYRSHPDYIQWNKDYDAFMKKNKLS